jgi:hypothetical protein
VRWYFRTYRAGVDLDSKPSRGGIAAELAPVASRVRRFRINPTVEQVMES